MGCLKIQSGKGGDLENGKSCFNSSEELAAVLCYSDFQPFPHTNGTSYIPLCIQWRRYDILISLG
ncbi:hypothetical protein Lepto7375DRAFT_4283 [Leptolyngbya sp. PCC 7375]|nr:hypothetical protein Lepto7375DRAFT_4283 [Leptolyngbya sp. PCC 7375]